LYAVTSMGKYYLNIFSIYNEGSKSRYYGKPGIMWLDDGLLSCRNYCMCPNEVEVKKICTI